MQLDTGTMDDILTRALAEDLGRGDITSQLTVPETAQACFSFIARDAGVIAGIPLIERLASMMAQPLQLKIHAQDGMAVSPGTKLLTISGNARQILAMERVALNLLQHLSGIATLARAYAQAVEGTRAKVLDTRKTTPGLRLLEKYAVATGGCYNHRLRLDDGILIKDNHIRLAGGITQAVQRAKKSAPSGMSVEVECDTLDQVKEALLAGADRLLLDNMPLSTLKEAVTFCAGRIPLEASGGITLENIREIAQTGVDYISVGALTHSAPALDIGLDDETDA